VIDMGITPLQRTTLLAILAPYAKEINSVSLVGSRARGNHRPSSDIDLVLDGRLELTDVLTLASAFEESDLDVCVDLVRETDIDMVAIGKGFLAGAQLLFDRDMLTKAKSG
jgi:predicted nucleotidyltransferase